MYVCMWGDERIRIKNSVHNLCELFFTIYMYVYLFIVIFSTIIQAIVVVPDVYRGRPWTKSRGEKYIKVIIVVIGCSNGE